MENTTRYEILDQQTMSNCKIITNGYNRLFKAWTLPVLHGIALSEPVRFNELKRRIPSITSSSLSDRLSSNRITSLSFCSSFLGKAGLS